MYGIGIDNQGQGSVGYYWYQKGNDRYMRTYMLLFYLK